MIKKGLLAAGLLLATLAAAPQQASAGTSVNIGVGVGVGGAYNCGPYNNWCGRPYPYHPRPARLSCRQGERIVWNHGFSRVRPISCGWNTYVYNATRHGHYLRVRVNPWSGRIAY